jgi:hypothetical protein
MTKKEDIANYFTELKDQFWHEGLWFLTLPLVFPVVASIGYILFKSGR